MAEARAAGISRRMLRGTRLRVVTRGSTPRHVAGVVLDLRSSDAADPPITTIVTGVTGLRLYGVLVGAELPLRFATTHPHQVRRQGVKVTRVKHLPPQRGHIAVLEHCWMVAAGELDLLELVTGGDWLRRKRRTTVAKLEAYARGNSSRGCRTARAALALIRERVDSPRETYLRLCLVLADLPTPECNVVIRDDNGPIGRVDLVYLAFKIIIEYEGGPAPNGSRPVEPRHRPTRGFRARPLDIDPSDQTRP